jgi:hypothetical protein
MNPHVRNVPTLTLNNGVTLPAVGFGVFQTHRTRRSPPSGQHCRRATLHITQGVAWIQSRGQDKVIAYPGQTIYCSPGEQHWLGATPDSFMEHLAMLDNAEDPAGTTTWLEHVTDEDYQAWG